MKSKDSDKSDTLRDVGECVEDTVEQLTVTPLVDSPAILEGAVLHNARNDLANE